MIYVANVHARGGVSSPVEQADRQAVATHTPVLTLPVVKNARHRDQILPERHFTSPQHRAVALKALHDCALLVYEAGQVFV